MRKIVAGNWKMNKTYAEALDLTLALDLYCNSNIRSEVIIFPPAIYLHSLEKALKNKKLQLGAQNCADQLWGAYTGEVSIDMLQSIGIKHTLIGHSERRSLYKENNDLIAQKVRLAFQQKIQFILCIGETLQERENGLFSSVIQNQINSAVKNLSGIQELYIAYEPVWAIGTGKTATTTEIEEAHAFIKKYTSDLVHLDFSKIHVLYGGSCNEKNALDILSAKGVDGVLVGGASLQAESFKTIIQAAETCIQK